FSSSVYPLAADELFLPLLVGCFLGYVLTAALLVALAIDLRQKGLAQWVDRVTRLQEDPDIEEALGEVAQFDRAIGTVILRTHEASVQHRTMNAINQRINSSMDLEVILPEIIKSGVELIGATGGSVTLRDAEGACQNIAVHNLPIELLTMHIPRSLGIAAEVAERGEPIIIEDYSRYERRMPLLLEHNVRSGLGVPLINEGKIIGALTVATTDPTRRFASADAEVLSSFANQAAVAIRNARLYSENLQRMEELARAERELAKKTAQLRSLLSKTFRNEEEVRRRISADIHDGITQLVVGALCQVQSVKPLVGSSEHDGIETAARRLAVAQDLLNQTIDEMRSVIHDLRPPYLDESGLVHALQQCLQNFGAISGLRCRLEVVGSEGRLHPDKQVAIYRIMQEALNNVRKHAEAANAEVYVQFYPDKVAVTIQDRGKGFERTLSLRRAADHLGITGMEERAYSVGGSLQISSAPGHGTTVMLEVPTASTEPLAGNSEGARRGTRALKKPLGAVR
ncbi:MAG TPA: GAF domain-containing sensor histidine kinase, partial [Dehalococcoidia bacterium]|nr:GAF domain-containing sensor histidine kinase [Dehalococcoidia bacterium]